MNFAKLTCLQGSDQWKSIGLVVVLLCFSVVLLHSHSSGTAAVQSGDRLCFALILSHGCWYWVHRIALVHLCLNTENNSAMSLFYFIYFLQHVSVLVISCNAFHNGIMWV